MTAPNPVLAIDRNWPIVAAGALMTCVAFGAVFSLAVFLQPMADATGWSRAGISGAMTLAFLAMGVAGFGWGTLSDRIGPRRVVLAGVPARWAWRASWPAGPPACCSSRPPSAS